MPVLVNVTVCAALVVPTTWLPKVRLSAERLTSGPVAMAVPVRLIRFGLLGALLVMVMLPVRIPTAVGVNVTLIVQLAPAAKLLPQLFDETKSPLAVMLVSTRVVVPVFVAATVCGRLVVPTVWLAKFRLLVDRDSPGVTPVPLSPIVRGLPAPLSVIVTEPERAPAAVGVKVTLIVQLVPGATLEPQLFD